MTDMEIDKSQSEAANGQLEDRYFICPNCGEMDSEFFDDVLIRKISKEQYNRLSEEQKQYVNKKFESRVLLCEHCYDRTKRRSWLIRGLYIVAFILLYIVPIVAICLIPGILYVQKYKLTRNFDFEHAWKCRAVRRLQ